MLFRRDRCINIRNLTGITFIAAFWSRRSDATTVAASATIAGNDATVAIKDTTVLADDATVAVIKRRNSQQAALMRRYWARQAIQDMNAASVQRFLQGATVAAPYGRVRATELHGWYLEWAKANGEAPLNQTRFGQALSRIEALGHHPIAKNPNMNRGVYYTGVKKAAASLARLQRKTA